MDVENAATGYALAVELHRLAALVDPDYTPEALKARLTQAQIHFTEQLHLTIGDRNPQVAEVLMGITKRWRAAGG